VSFWEERDAYLRLYRDFLKDAEAATGPSRPRGA